ncbi:type II toxin-antitoxin system HicA family toxin [Candidatus Saccharibacteria bacterium]|nr:type II toxin-antitoxin system HicA family toxin [Candidatus Saccharibacteria bacterium]MBI3338086.1 type II toxin-antitoxin system HicA family toxin [Candidatus Saccharibacteria bacterium]
MPKLPQVSAADLTHAFRKMGFVKIGQKGSHIKMRDTHGRTAIIPNHKSIKPGTLKKGILNPLGITVEELIKHLK